MVGIGAVKAGAEEAAGLRREMEVRQTAHDTALREMSARMQDHATEVAGMRREMETARQESAETREALALAQALVAHGKASSAANAEIVAERRVFAEVQQAWQQAREEEARRHARTREALDAASSDLIHLREALRERMEVMSAATWQISARVDEAVGGVREMRCRTGDWEATERELTSALREGEVAACHMREVMAAREADVARLQREVEAAKGEAAEKCAALAASSAETHRVREALDALGRQMHAVEREKAAAERRCAEMEQMIRGSEMDADALRKREAELRMEVEKCAGERQQSKEQLRQKHAHIEALRSGVATCEAGLALALGALRQSAEALPVEARAGTRASVACGKAALTMMDYAVHGLPELEGIQRLGAELSMELATFTELMQESTDRQRILESEVGDARACQAELRAVLDEAQDAAREEAAASKAKEDEIRTLSASVEMLTRTVAEGDAAMAARDTVLASAKGEMEAQADAVRELELRVQAHAAGSADAQMVLAERDREVAALRREMEARESAHGTVLLEKDAMLASQDQALAEARREAAGKTAALAQVSEEEGHRRRRLEAQCDGARQMLADLRAAAKERIAQMQTGSEDAGRRLEEAVRELRGMAARMGEQEEEVQRLTRAVAEARARDVGAEAGMKEREDALEALRREVVVMGIAHARVVSERDAMVASRDQALAEARSEAEDNAAALATATAAAMQAQASLEATTMRLHELQKVHSDALASLAGREAAVAEKGSELEALQLDHARTVAQWDAILAGKEEALAGLRREVAAQSQALAAAAEGTSRLQASLEEQSKGLMDVEGEQRETLVKLAGLEKALAEKETAIDELRREGAEQRAEGERRSEELRKLGKDLGSKGQANEELKLQLDYALRVAREEAAASKAKEDEIRTLSASVEMLTRTVAEGDAAMAARDTVLASAKGEMEAQADAVRELELRVQAHAAGSADAQMVLAERDREVAALRREMEARESAHGTVLLEKDAMLASQDQALAEARREAAGKTAALAQVSEEEGHRRRRLEAQCDGARQMLADLRAAAKERIAQMQTGSEDAGRRLEEAVRELRGMAARMGEQEAEIQRLAKAVSEGEGRTSQMHQVLTEREDALAALRRETAEERRGRQAAIEKIGALAEQVSSLQTVVCMKEEAARRLVEQVSELEGRVAVASSMAEHEQTPRNSRVQSEAKAPALGEQLNSLETESEKECAEAKLQRIQSELDAAREELARAREERQALATRLMCGEARAREVHGHLQLTFTDLDTTLPDLVMACEDLERRAQAMGVQREVLQGRVVGLTGAVLSDVEGAWRELGFVREQMVALDEVIEVLRAELREEKRGAEVRLREKEDSLQAHR